MIKKVIPIAIILLLFISFVSVVNAEGENQEYIDLINDNKELKDDITLIKENAESMASRLDEVNVRYNNLLENNGELKNKITDLTGDIKSMSSEVEKLTSLMSDPSYEKYSMEDVIEFNDIATKEISLILMVATIILTIFVGIAGIAVPLWRKKSDDEKQEKLIEKQKELDDKVTYSEIKMKKEFKDELDRMSNYIKEIDKIKLDVRDLTKDAENASNESKFLRVVSESYTLQNNKKYEEALKVLSEFDDNDNLKDQLDSEKGRVYTNWGVNLTDEARKSKNNELFRKAIRFFEKALVYRPDDYYSHSNLSTTFLELGRITNDDELIEQGFEKSKIMYEKLSSSYNLACSYAIMDDSENAFKYLDEALAKKEITPYYAKIEDDDWIKYRTNPEFERIINKYSF